MKPLILPPNPIQHFYRGGDRIAALRGIVAASDHQPEEWLAATVSRFDDPVVGLALTAEGSYLRDVITDNPTEWVGPQLGRDQSDVGILVKLLDARQRLPVHVHPERDFARTHLDCPYGKTEAWYVLESEADCAVYLGWKDDVNPSELNRRRDAQDSEWMLDHMNQIVATPGMGILVPAGTVHAIDGGIFVAEVQEPTDLSILLEWSVTTSTREESHLGLGFDTVMPSVSTRALEPEALASLVRVADESPTPGSLGRVLPEAADPYFRLHRLSSAGDLSGQVPAGFAVVLITDGSGELTSGKHAIAVHHGDVLAVPHSFGPWQLHGQAHALVGRPGTDWPRSLRTGGIR